MASNNVNYTLIHSIEFGDREIKELSIRRLKAKDLMALKSDPTPADMGNLISKTTGEAIAVINELDAADFLAISDILGNFMQAGQGNGPAL